MRQILAAAALCLATTPALALNICVEGAYPPFSETAADGSIIGFDIDIANAICEQMGEPCNLVKVDWDGIIPALLEQKCDAIVASMSSTAERKQVIDFTGKYYQVPNEFVGRADSGIDPSTPEGLAGKVVGAQRGTIHQAYMEKHYPGVQLTLYGSQDEAILDLTSGRIDLIVGDAIQLEEGFVNTPQGEGYARIGEQFFDPEIHGEGAAVGVRKDSAELRDKISAAILAIRESGKYDEIQKKYFDIDIYGS
jgi:arginine/ornithine transport system substrate-binding protein